jgi:hypothetical protein
MIHKDECQFCSNLLEECRCGDFELKLKNDFLNFLFSAIQEFSPKSSKKLSKHDAVEFVNDWFSLYFDHEAGSR